MSTKKLNQDLISNEIKEFQKANKDKQLEKIQQMKTDLQESIKQKEDGEDPDNILYSNIERANRFLDILEDRITGKSENVKKESTSRLFEVSAQLINAITSATQSIAGSYQSDLDYQYKLEKLELENKKLMIQYALKGGEGGEGNTTNNLIVSSREDILDMINAQKSDTDQGE